MFTFYSPLSKSASHPALISNCASHGRSSPPTTMGSFYQAQWPLKNLALMFTSVSLCQYMSALQTEIPISAGSFANPGANVRPRFRYWLPDASVDADTVAADIAAADSISAGGIELLSLFEYGGGARVLACWRRLGYVQLWHSPFSQHLCSSTHCSRGKWARDGILTESEPRTRRACNSG